MSRKQKAFRAWYYKADAAEMNVQTAFAAGWNAHKGVAHARTIQELQTENERLREIMKYCQQLVTEYRELTDYQEAYADLADAAQAAIDAARVE